MNNPLKKVNKLNIARANSYFKRNGLSETFYKVCEKLSRDKAEKFYNEEFLMMRVREETLNKQRETSFIHAYKISILVPAYETDSVYLTELLDSVTGQSYKNWELIIADGSVSGLVRRCVEQYAECLDDKTASKIKYLALSENGGISANTNAALYAATGEYIALLDHDDVLEKDALFEVVSVLDKNIIQDGNIYYNKIKVVYTDEDKTDSKTLRYFDPHFKPDFNMDLLRSNNYICHFLVVRRELALSIGGFRPEYDGSQDYDFILRAVENIPVDAIYHVDKVLYHWRSHLNSTAENTDSKLYAYDAGKRAIEDHLKRKGLDGEVIDTKHRGFYRVKYAAEDSSVKMVTRTEWNDFSEKEINEIEEEFIMILADDLEATSEDYISEFLGVLRRYEVGCVGGKIYDKHYKVESAGFLKNSEGDFAPSFNGLNGHFSGYMHRANLMQKVDGVSLDCMMIRRCAIEFKDNKPNLKRGYITVYDPYAEFRRK